IIVTVPLLEGIDGVNKMSKSYNNYVGIDEPPDVMFGKLMSISDELMLKYYELLSDITIEELNALKEGIKNGTIHPKDAKVRFAKEIIARFHSKDAAEAAHINFEKVFKEKEIPEDIETIEVKKDEIDRWLPRLLLNIGMVSSTSEGKRMINQGAVTINGEKATSEDTPISEALIIKLGKRKFKKIILK
ncbi:MAG TPA: tyrosine--tRNA ligase, partial [Syntrophorhabdaceae bacterium]|nr:tyrosine--tRNA ligase [Syntrophorhabdaceae bacterium]